jgi:hypothetical protein
MNAALLIQRWKNHFPATNSLPFAGGTFIKSPGMSFLTANNH